MSPAWTIRPARRDELPAVLELWRVAESIPTVSDSETALALLLDRDPDALLIAEREGAIAGTLIAGWDGWRGSLYRLAVAPAERRRGLATALVRDAERRLMARGALRVQAIVHAGEEHAMGFWAAVGYEHQPGHARFVRLVGEAGLSP